MSSECAIAIALDVWWCKCASGELCYTSVNISVYNRLYRCCAKAPHISQGCVHITGGGFTENLPRVMPKGLACEVQSNSWKWPGLFQWLQQVPLPLLFCVMMPINCNLLLRCIVSKTKMALDSSALGGLVKQGSYIRHSTCSVETQLIGCVCFSRHSVHCLKPAFAQ